MKKLKYFILSSIIIAVVLLISGSILGGFDQLETLYQRGEFDIEVPFVETVDIKMNIVILRTWKLIVKLELLILLNMREQLLK
ncbi:hypothetical protein SD457_14945 [Coprobacillaceae bacterium CR2/5/TPMF4]|nr:hypothetical protein SD457_14945 [Coprobacillaceae bacterium CR2/5/TPMF4]